MEEDTEIEISESMLHGFEGSPATWWGKEAMAGAGGLAKPKHEVMGAKSEQLGGGVDSGVVEEAGKGDGMDTAEVGLR